MPIQKKPNQKALPNKVSSEAKADTSSRQMVPLSSLRRAPQGLKDNAISEPCSFFLAQLVKQQNMITGLKWTMEYVYDRLTDSLQSSFDKRTKGKQREVDLLETIAMAHEHLGQILKELFYR